MKIKLSTSKDYKALNEVKQLLQEVTYEQALELLNSKAVRKEIFKNYMEFFKAYYDEHKAYYDEHDEEFRRQTTGKFIDNTIQTLLNSLKFNINILVPRDIEDKQKALCVVWLKRYFLDSKNFKTYIVGPNKLDNSLHSSLERYFQWHRFTAVLRERCF